MTDPTKRLAEVERNSVPDLWGDISSRRPRDLRAEHELSGRGRLLVIFVAFAVAIAGIGGAVYAFRGTHPAPRIAGQTAVGRSGVIAPRPINARISGQLECTATIPSAEVQPGHELGATFSVTNTSSRPVTVGIGFNGMRGWVRYYDASGNLLADTSHTHDGIIGPAPEQKPVPPGQSIDIGSMDTPIVWPGPLRVVPYCDGREMVSRSKEPIIRVSTTGPAPSAQGALNRAMSSISPVFDSCVPTPNGSVTGTVRGPKTGSPISARCQSVVQTYPGFDVVTVAAVVPSDAPPVPLQVLSEELGVTPGLGLLKGPVGVTWWTFVVTDGSVTLTHHTGSTVCANSSGSGGGGIAHC